ncbi:hypothetical protein VKT23_019203 [Stygiomarasmius scandens]|uniref:Uncharacterized protein n=1 Tax=Marasmiellus scandens TaxID=2682957 RepID=A0ABR1IM13_9AGAR
MSRRKKLLANRDAMMTLRTGPDELSTITTIAAGGSTHVAVVGNATTAQQATTSCLPDFPSGEAATAQPETMSFRITKVGEENLQEEENQGDGAEKKKRKKRKRSKKNTTGKNE